MTRFGRSVESQVVDAVTARFEGGGPSHVTVRGVSLGVSEPSATSDSDMPQWAAAETERDWRSRYARRPGASCCSGPRSRGSTKIRGVKVADIDG